MERSRHTVKRTDENAATNVANAFTRTAPELLTILDELRAKEPLFHSPGFGTSAADFERIVAEHYWEVGASGRRYSRDFILRELYTQPPALADDLGWKAWDHAVKQLGPQTYLITYVLEQGERRTRRASIWEKSSGRWCVLYHQGTVISAEEDDVAPV